MKNKKAEANSMPMWKIITLILIVLVIIAVLIWAYYFNLPEKLRNLFPSFIQSEELKQMQDEQKEIPAEEKTIGSKEYPSFYFYYDENGKFDSPDHFIFRWNFNLNRAQVLTNTNKNGFSSEWLFNPLLDKKYSGNIYENTEARKITFLINSPDYISFVSNLIKIFNSDVNDEIRVYLIDGSEIKRYSTLWDELFKNPGIEHYSKKSNPLPDLEAINTFFRQNYADSFKSFDDEKLIQAKNQIKKVEDGLNLWFINKQKNDIILTNLAGWYIVGNSGKQFTCLCSTPECNPDYAVCTTEGTGSITGSTLIKSDSRGGATIGK